MVSASGADHSESGQRSERPLVAPDQVLNQDLQHDVNPEAEALPHLQLHATPAKYRLFCQAVARTAPISGGPPGSLHT